ncbi:hypothetical protein CO058_03205 [candidate division WWE3 bacterium CG_4_9_14_0_2_um_filter_35_11]|uniref:Uncharacterized protein n=1 Tax=candidate division WWE3 bacterium CG_4_9_14_0_2_um_filter_35_11 TaxID=1975077 RepID=A0A2M8EL76_UNCKA|nr:MAG: hypothetical protein COV25_03695 [candidate division WWE3 bacterium CG10_big_fil_rev_8_21_14_0_10_35_32]PJC23493.1 MAG: hypothetical protein CO058_03205 [candidate division WWE3 bacterium CG_4_9_14_0_2_um_filter_35_11]
MKNQRIVLPVVVVAILLIAVFAYTASINLKNDRDEDAEKMTTETEEAMMKKDLTVEDPMTNESVRNSRYIEYSEKVLDKVTTNRIVLFFYAT